MGQDNGRLLIGTDLVDAAAAHLDGCDAKLCLLHHPFDMFAEWNRKQLRRRLARQFQFLFTGHVHDSDVEFLHQIFGNVFVSTSGALNSREAFNFYSIVQIDLAKGTVTSLLRKWYDDRDCFDQETEKAAEGRISYSGFRATNEETAQLIEISEIRGLLHENSGNAQLVNPLEGVAELKLRDVFVEPIIKDRSSFDRDDDDAGTFTVDDLLRNSDNLVFFGQPEFGKSMLLEYAETIHTHDRRLLRRQTPGTNQVSRSTEEQFQGYITHRSASFGRNGHSRASRTISGGWPADFTYRRLQRPER